MNEAFKEINEIKQIIDELGRLNVKKKADLVSFLYIIYNLFDFKRLK